VGAETTRQWKRRALTPPRRRRCPPRPPRPPPFRRPLRPLLLGEASPTSSGVRSLLRAADLLHPGFASSPADPGEVGSDLVVERHDVETTRPVASPLGTKTAPGRPRSRRWCRRGRGGAWVLWSLRGTALYKARRPGINTRSSWLRGFCRPIPRLLGLWLPWAGKVLYGALIAIAGHS
jgi:hypothetical protein